LETDLGGRRRHPPRRGFTLIEILLVTLIIGVLASISAPMFGRVLERARIAKAIGDVDAIGMDLIAFELTEGGFPDSLEEIDRDHLLDPWGNPYQYTRIRGGSGGPGTFRKDRFLVPINSDFDLYSMGPDGKSVSPLTAASSRDDIIRANDGGYVGVAEFY
jgi:general secretion pathway protein G